MFNEKSLEVWWCGFRTVLFNSAIRKLLLPSYRRASYILEEHFTFTLDQKVRSRISEKVTLSHHLTGSIKDFFSTFAFQKN